MTVDNDTLKATLKSLGSGPNAVARRLLEAGAFGDPEDSSSCAVAQHLRATFPEEGYVEVTGAEVAVNGASVKTPAAIATFIVEFDEYNRPELIRHDVSCTGMTRTRYDDYSDAWVVECGCGTVYRLFGANLTSESRKYFVRAQRGHFPGLSA